MSIQRSWNITSWAAIGSCALAVGGALVVMASQDPTATVTASTMSVGQTTTATSPPTTMPIPVATPGLKAKRPKGF